MSTEQSVEWLSLLEKEEAFRKAVGQWNQTVDSEVQKNDILRSLDDRIGQLIVTRLMNEGYNNTEVVEAVWEKLVYLVFYGNVSVSAWAASALIKIPHVRKNEYRDDLALLAIEYADIERNDDIALYNGLDLLYKFNCKEAVIQYIDKFKDYLGLDDEDINYFTGTKA